jgi:class 3 adenylate cyclase
MTQPSPELLAVSRRWYDAITHNRASDMRNLLSQQDYLRFVGTGENEVWNGHLVREGVGDFYASRQQQLVTKETSAEAFENGDTGWSCFTHDIVFAHQPDTVITFRTTLVFTLEDGSWKIIQRHGSVGVPNRDIVGAEQTAIAQLVAAAREGFSLTQREGLASVMFTDIVNSSALAAAIGDRVWSGMISDHFSALRRIIQTQGGQFVKSLGDGTFSSFPSARGALTAAQEIRAHMAQQTTEPHLNLRIGIHTGDVVQSDEDFFGTVVNKAARITSIAEPDCVLVSDATRAMVGTGSDFAFSAPFEMGLSGFDGQQVLYRLEQQT